MLLFVVYLRRSTSKYAQKRARLWQYTSSNAGQDDDTDKKKQPPVSVPKPVDFHADHKLTTATRLSVHLDYLKVNNVSDSITKTAMKYNKKLTVIAFVSHDVIIYDVIVHWYCK